MAVPTEKRIEASNIDSLSASASSYKPRGGKNVEPAQNQKGEAAPPPKAPSKALAGFDNPLVKKLADGVG